MNEDFDDFGNLRSWQEPPPKGVDLDTPPRNWPFPTWKGQSLPKPKRQPRPAPTYPDAPL